MHPGGFPSGCVVSMWLLMGGAAYTVVAHIPHASSLRSYTNGVTEISASATRLPSCAPSPTWHRADSRLALRHIIADMASCRQPTRSAPHHRRHGIVQTADSRQRRVTPRNPIRTTRSAEGAWGVGLHHRYELRRCATIPEAEWSDIAARRVGNAFWGRCRCRTEK